MDIDGWIRRFPHGRLARRALGRRPYGVPSQTTPELLFYRKDSSPKAGHGAARDHRRRHQAAANHFHDPRMGRYGMAWNAARGTALGHTFMMTCADFGQPVIDLPGWPADSTPTRLGEDYRPTIDTEAGLAAADYLMRAAGVFAPDILSMSWFERVRPYAAGKSRWPMATRCSRRISNSTHLAGPRQQTGYLPHPARARRCAGRAGGRLCARHSGQPAEEPRTPRKALVAFTSRARRSSTSRTAAARQSALFGRRRPRGAPPVADLRGRRPDVLARRASVLATPADPANLGDHRDLREELHDMLRGLRNAARRADKCPGRAEQLAKKTSEN
jgi:multiple sugar transport system substrate-binding protein